MGNESIKIKKNNEFEDQCLIIMKKHGRPIDYHNCKRFCWELRQSRVYMSTIVQTLKLKHFDKWLENGKYPKSGKIFLNYLRTLSDQHGLRDKIFYEAVRETELDFLKKQPVNLTIDNHHHILFAFPGESIKDFARSVLHCYGNRSAKYLVLADDQFIDQDYACVILCGSVQVEMIQLNEYKAKLHAMIESSTKIYKNLIVVTSKILN